MTGIDDDGHSDGKAKARIHFSLLNEQIMMAIHLSGPSLSGLRAFISTAAWRWTKVAFEPESPKNLALNNPALLVAAVAVVMATYCLLEIDARVKLETQLSELNDASTKYKSETMAELERLRSTESSQRETVTKITEDLKRAKKQLVLVQESNVMLREGTTRSLCPHPSSQAKPSPGARFGMAVLRFSTLGGRAERLE